MSTIAERVQAGVDWLDINAPGWVDKVEVISFNIRNTCQCVLGQVFASKVNESQGIYDGFGYVTTGREKVLSWEESENLGFDQPEPPMKAYMTDEDWEQFDIQNEQNWVDLQKEWERVITERKAAQLDFAGSDVVDSLA